MPLTNSQIDTLLKLTASTADDQLDCDSCFQHLAEFAESQLYARERTQIIELVDRHLEQCPCCRTEYESLIHSLLTQEFAEDD